MKIHSHRNHVVDLHWFSHCNILTKWISSFLPPSILVIQYSGAKSAKDLPIIHWRGSRFGAYIPFQAASLVVQPPRSSLSVRQLALVTVLHTRSIWFWFGGSFPSFVPYSCCSSSCCCCCCYNFNTSQHCVYGGLFEEHQCSNPIPSEIQTKLYFCLFHVISE